MTLSMQPLVHIKQHNIALLFNNYLRTLSIESKLVEENQGYALYCSEDNIERVKHEFEQFIKNPFDAKYQQAAWQYGETVDIKTHDLNGLKKNFLEHAGIVTLTVFVLCWIVFLALSTGTFTDQLNHLPFYRVLSFDAFIHDPLRLIGPAFIHFSILHIVFNTMWWWQLGGLIEKQLGKIMLLNVFFISAIFSNLAQYMEIGANFNGIFGGLSGVVYALVGFVWWMGWLMPEKGLSLSKPIVGFLLFWLMLGYVDLLPVNVANSAHLAGLISGCLLAVFQAKVFGKTN